ncbi:multicopper oxidase family protein [Loktanella sp. M215]|uniref:multicopper oxidase family protein n=1 Tax=Loktanella sp. M215 TaxID=2675431 RepID=UPI001F2ABBBF|nr:multicopper oxidase domain-containing protein [Loktanella sp. M215]MCF7701800.1 multicopper oxidase domain-containing protein [Loktanella sp. M215]
MYLSRHESKRRQREAQNARNNRAEVVKALSTGQVSRRELMKWGVFTATGALTNINGLSPFAGSAYAKGQLTGVPRSETFGVLPFTQKMTRLELQEPLPLTPIMRGGEIDVAFPAGTGELAGRRMSYHTDFLMSGKQMYINPRTGIGPYEGRPPGAYFAHQRWAEYLPKQAYVMSLAPVGPSWNFHPDLPYQLADQVWTFTKGQGREATTRPPLIKLRYGEPVLFRHYNMLPVNPAQNGGFGSTSQATHNHNAHNASASDGASNAHFFPGQFYDYHWSTTLARADTINTDMTDRRASGPDGQGGLVHVKGDFRELQGSLWFHDHRFFYTAENVYKGHVGMVNYYSGPDRGNEVLDDGVNLQFPSGSLLDWGNIDFDVNLLISDAATDLEGEYFFDIFNTDGFLGDLMLVNFNYKPYIDVLPRKYRFRLLNACMSRFIRLQLKTAFGNTVPMEVISADGNLLERPVTVNMLDTMGVAERFDVVVDFSHFDVGQRINMVNLVTHKTGRGPSGLVDYKAADNGKSGDPATGSLLQFRIVDQVESVDVPGVIHYATQNDRSRIPSRLTEQIPVVEPTRIRFIELKRGEETPVDRRTGECNPSCPRREVYPWSMRVNGNKIGGFNANHISELIPRPGEIEHWVLRNPGGGWDHPLHLHFEEGVTIDRGKASMSKTEKFARKDVWRLGELGEVRMQVQFSEYGGAYVSHCHNTVHEDSAMIMRVDILTDPNNPYSSRTQAAVIPTPNPTPEGVTYTTPEILAAGNPFDRKFNPFPNIPPLKED